MPALNRVDRLTSQPHDPVRRPGLFSGISRGGSVLGTFSTEPRRRYNALGSAVPMPETLLYTPLHARHVELGARMVPFAGWEMPVQYEGVIAEHRAVRTDSGVFDVSHMGELEVEGPRARELLQGALSNDPARLPP